MRIWYNSRDVERFESKRKEKETVKDLACGVWLQKERRRKSWRMENSRRMRVRPCRNAERFENERKGKRTRAGEKKMREKKKERKENDSMVKLGCINIGEREEVEKDICTYECAVGLEKDMYENKKYVVRIGMRVWH